MGLRAQGLGWVLGLTLGLGAAGLALLTRQLASSFDQLEREQLLLDVRRLQAGMDLMVATRQRSTREWAQWSALRDHVERPQPRFRDEQLSPRALQASALDWLLVLRGDGTPLEAVSADGRPFPLAALLDRATPRGQRLLKMPPSQGLCALDRWLGQLYVICQHPIRDSEARETPVGIVITGELLTDAHLGALRDMLGLPFTLLPGAALPPGETWADLPGVAVESQARQMRLHWVLRVGDEAPHSLLRLDWPREQREQRDRTLRGGQAVLLAVALLLALAVLILIDWRLVRRLRQLKTRLAALREGEHWDHRLPEDGADEIGAVTAEANHLLARIDGQVRTLSAQGRTDTLTGLANRRGFEEALQAALGRCRRSRQPLCLVLLDADHFKRFNDEHGHAAGDAALRVLAEGLRGQVARRVGDMAARWGGEEFVVLFEGSEAAVAAARIERLREWLKLQPLREAGGLLVAPLTVSAGLAQARADEDADALLQRADAALYRAKGEGRDRLVSA